MNPPADDSPAVGSFERLPTTRGTAALRWLRFNLVGGLGIAVQLCILAALKSGLQLDYTWATELAVEVAVAHNFLWHERFTCGRPPIANNRCFALANLI